MMHAAPDTARTIAAISTGGFLHSLSTFGLLVLAVAAVLVIGIIAAVVIRLDRADDGSWQRWYDRVATFPTTNALVLFAMLNFFVTGIVVAGNTIYFAVTAKIPSPLFVDALATWLDKVLMLSGIATVQFGVKRATEKPAAPAAPAPDAPRASAAPAAAPAPAASTEPPRPSRAE